MTAVAEKSPPKTNVAAQPRLQISKVNDLHTHTFQRNLVLRNYKSCAGVATSALVLPEIFRGNGGDRRDLNISISRSKFPNRPMEIILDGVRPHWTSYKCAIRRSDDEEDDLEFAEIKFVRETNGSGTQVSGIFKDQLRDDLYIRLTICVSESTESTKRSTALVPPPAQISKLFMKETHSDFRIICAFEAEDEHIIPVHKNVLTIASPYFKAMLQGDTAENRNSQVTLTVIPYKALAEILYCIYHGEHSDAFKNTALDVLVAADFLEMIPLRDFAADFLEQNLDPSTVFKVLHVALQLSLQTLARQCCLYVKENVNDDEAKRKFTELLRDYPELMAMLIKLI